MKKFAVIRYEVVARTVHVHADDAKEAKQLADDMFELGEGEGEYIDTLDVSVVEVEG